MTKIPGMGGIISNVPGVAVSLGEFKIRMIFMNSAANSLTPSITVSSISNCQGIMLKEYVDFAHEIEKSLKRYKELLIKDLADIEKSEKLFELADYNISVLFRNVIGAAKTVLGSGNGGGGVSSSGGGGGSFGGGGGGGGMR